jgi:hypothetical protein
MERQFRLAVEKLQLTISPDREMPIPSEITPSIARPKLSCSPDIGR